MIYVVTGTGSGGSSLMMRILVKGGIDALHNERRDPRNLRFLNNPYGTFEYNGERKPEILEGKSVKIFHVAEIRNLAPHEVRVIWIRREAEHILASQRERADRRGERFFKRIEDVRYTLDRQEKGMEKLKEVASFAICEVDYEDVFNDTERVLARLKAFLGEPFDSTKAFEAIDFGIHKIRG